MQKLELPRQVAHPLVQAVDAHQRSGKSMRVQELTCAGLSIARNHLASWAGPNAVPIVEDKAW
jgi:hypothetical protein